MPSNNTVDLLLPCIITLFSIVITIASEKDPGATEPPDKLNDSNVTKNKRGKIATDKGKFFF